MATIGRRASSTESFSLSGGTSNCPRRRPPSVSASALTARRWRTGALPPGHLARHESTAMVVLNPE
jgi:hypothetical protein